MIVIFVLFIVAVIEAMLNLVSVLMTHRTLGNHMCDLTLDEQGFNGFLQDWKLTFKVKTNDMKVAATESLPLFKRLIESLQSQDVKGRLIAYIELKDLQKPLRLGSYCSEWITLSDLFYARHMKKIIEKVAETMEGNAYVLNHIMIQLSVFSSTTLFDSQHV